MIGEKLKSIREAYNLSQKEVANKLNVSNTTLSNYENNLRDPDINFVKAYANLIGLPPDYLISYVYNESVSESYEQYQYHTNMHQDIDFAFLPQEKINELPLSELLKIREFADYIYNRYKYKTK